MRGIGIMHTRHACASIGNSAERTAFQSKIDQLADEAAEGVTSLFEVYLKKIKQNVTSRISRANRKKLQKFIMIHTAEELRSIIKKGEDLNLTQREIEDFIFISCRKDIVDKSGNVVPKTINATDLKQQMANWKQIKANGYPARFSSLEAFTEFSHRTKSLMAQFGLPSNEVFIQGSSLRKLSPMVADDIDIAVFLTKEQLEAFIQKQVNVYKIRKSVKLTNTNSEIKKYEKNIRTSILEEGRIAPEWFKTVNGKTINELAELPFDGNPHIFSGLTDFVIPPDQKKFNLSIIIRNEDFDTSPYLKLR